MNLTTIGHIPSSNLKRIKGQYVAAVAGVALAVSALVAFSPDSTSSKPPAQTSQAIVPTVGRDAGLPYRYFYVVATEAERGALVHEGAANVVIVGSEAAQVLVGEGSRELNALGIPATIIDMTVGPSSVTSVRRVSESDIAASVLSTEQANYLIPASASKASEANIAASVLSTEMAAYDFTATRPAQRQALEADIMASVISTEKAAGD